MAQAFITAPVGWHRVGRGKEIQFFATDGEVQEWLRSGLPGEAEPYVMVATREGQQLIVATPSNFLELRSSSDPARIQFWIASESISGLLPDLSTLTPLPLADAVCAVNGFLLLQHGRMFENAQDVSRVAITNVVRNSETGEERTHREYLSIFKSLAGRIAQDLRYSTIRRQADGREVEDPELVRMTDGARAGYESGTALTSRPGRLL
jgi:hypothetical protein